MKMKQLLLLFILSLSWQVVCGQKSFCPPNPDRLYERRDVLNKLSQSLKKSVAGFPEEFLVENERAVRFVIFDLSDPTNNSVYGNRCVNFIAGHVYHFSPVNYSYSLSSIAILYAGEVKIFEAVNCGAKNGKLNEILSFLRTNSEKIPDFENTLKRTANYRRYGFWTNISDLKEPNLLNCESNQQNGENSEKSFNRNSVLKDMARILYKNSPQSYRKRLFINLTENEKAIGFYVQDLVDLKNKQTSLLENIEFKEGHVYLFGWIDGPYSKSQLAVLKDSKLSFFEAVDCRPDQLKKLITYVKNNFTVGNQTRELLGRIENYRNYRFSVPFGSEDKMRCN